MATPVPNTADPYWANLIGNISGGTQGRVVSTAAKGGGLKSIGKLAKRVGPELLGWMLLERYLSGRHESKMQDIQMEAAREQAAMTTPENLYQQAALPQARQREEMARNALLTQLAGGVTGPTLARGETLIGG